MIKKVVVEYYKGKPIWVHEVKDLKGAELQDFLSVCKNNLAQKNKDELDQELQKLEKEKMLLKRITILEAQNILLKKAVCSLAGLDLTEQTLDENIKGLIGE